MVTSSNLSKKFNYLGEDDNNDDDDNSFHSSTPPLDHNKYTNLMTKERAEVFGPRESSAQFSSTSPGETSF